jgi:CheY-like chemotaxis protein
MQTDNIAQPKILVVDDNQSVRLSLAAVLRANQFTVTAAANVGEALQLIASEAFDVLLCDLDMPGAGNGFTVVSAMRHTNPKAVTLVFTGYPALKEAMNAILPPLIRLRYEMRLFRHSVHSSSVSSSDDAQDALQEIYMKSKSTFLLAVLLTAATLVSTAFSEKKKSADGAAIAEITKLEQGAVKADLENDPSFLKAHSADDYTAGSSWGNWETKASILKDMSEPQANKTNKEEMTDLKVRMYGNTAIATYNESYDSLYHGANRARTTMCTDTWVKDSGWKLVAGHCSEVAK